MRGRIVRDGIYVSILMLRIIKDDGSIYGSDLNHHTLLIPITNKKLTVCNVSLYLILVPVNILFIFNLY